MSRGGQFSNRLRFCYRFTTEFTTEFDSVNSFTDWNSVVFLLHSNFGMHWWEKMLINFWVFNNNRFTTELEPVNQFTDLNSVVILLLTKISIHRITTEFESVTESEAVQLNLSKIAYRDCLTRNFLSSALI